MNTAGSFDDVRPLSKNDVLAIHEASIEKFGGATGLRDQRLLDSALAQPFQSFGGVELYPGVVDKACRYCFGVIKDHPFIDGNKRTGAALLGTYLRINGLRFSPEPLDFLHAMMSVADGSLTYEDLVAWVKSVV